MYFLSTSTKLKQDIVKKTSDLLVAKFMRVSIFIFHQKINQKNLLSILWTKNEFVFLLVKPKGIGDECIQIQGRKEARNGWIHCGQKKRQLLYCFFDDFESFSSRLLLQHKRNDKGFYSEIS